MHLSSIQVFLALDFNSKMMKILRTILLLALMIGCQSTPQQKQEVTYDPLITSMYTADPSAHVFDGALYIYPSHDIDGGVPEDDLGSHFAMRDYHVLKMNADETAQDMGKALDLDDIPWTKKQLWAPDIAEKNGTYYFYFPAKDADEIFRIGVATGSTPEGPFTAEESPIAGAVSIDPAVFKDSDGSYYMYFGGIWGGQLQRWESGSYVAEDRYPAADEVAIAPKVAKMSEDMLQFETAVQDIQLLDAEGNPILAGDNERRFFEAAWVHQYNGKYYFSYSTGDTHNIAYAIGDSPLGPFTYQGVILKPVLGWTNHHSIVEYEGAWYLYFHDSSLSKGVTHLRSIKRAKLEYLPDGRIQTIDALVEVAP